MNTLKRAAAALALLLPIAAQAQDSWGGRDKRWHAGMSCFFGAGAAAWQRERPLVAWGVAMVPGVLKETLDATNATGTGWSWKDIGANALGAGLCVAGARVLISADRGRTEARIGWEF